MAAVRFLAELVVWPVVAARCAGAVSRRTLVAVGACVLVAAAVLVLLVAALRATPPTYPTGDQALIELYTIHASNGALSVGAYSRKRWHHPGPAYFFVLAPLHALTGHEFSLRWTVLLLNLAATVAAIVLAARYGGWPLAWGLMAALSVYFFRPSPGPFLGFGSLLSSAWNPHAPVLPLALLLVLCARLGSGGISTLPWIVLVASFVAQTHVALLPCAVSVTTSAALLYRFGRRNPAEPRPTAFWIHAAIWVLVVLWCLPVLEQLQGGSSGNLARIASDLRQVDSPIGTPTLATSFVALSYALWTAVDLDAARIAHGSRLPSPTEFDFTATVWSVLQIGWLVVAGVWAARTRRTFSAALCLIGLVAIGTAFWSITKIDGPLRAYVVFWISIVGVVNTAALLGLVVDWSGERLRISSIAGWLTVVAFGALLVGHGVSTLHANHQRLLDGTGYLQAARDRTRVLVAAVEEDMERSGHRRPLIRMTRGHRLAAAGVVLHLRKAGIPVTVDDGSLWMFTEALRATGVEDVEFLFSRAEPDEIDRSPYRLVAEQGASFVYAKDISGRPRLRVR